MAHKRSRAKFAIHIPCPHCGVRLWRLNSKKSYIFFENAKSVMEATGYNRKRSTFLTLQGVFVDYSRWVEDFFCSQHGIIWLIVHKDKITGQHDVRIPSDQEWQRVSGLLDPNRPNPSVSEYSWRASRGAKTSS